MCIFLIPFIIETPGVPVSWQNGRCHLKMIDQKGYYMDEFIIVLSVGKPYDIAPENGGDHITGCTMQYVSCQDISKPYFDEDSGSVGYVPLKERMGVEFYDLAKANGLPAVAKVVYGMKSSGGKQTLYIKGLDFVPVKPSK